MVINLNILTSSLTLLCRPQKNMFSLQMLNQLVSSGKKIHQMKKVSNSNAFHIEMCKLQPKCFHGCFQFVPLQRTFVLQILLYNKICQLIIHSSVEYSSKFKFAKSWLISHSFTLATEYKLMN